MPALNVGDAIDLFFALFDIAIWAVGFLSLAYLLKIVRVLGSRFKKIDLHGRRR